MDPTTIIGVTAAIQQLLNCIFKYSQGVREAKTEINALCSELLGRRAALSHVHFIAGLDDKSDEITQEGKGSLSSTMFDTPQFHEMLLSTKIILQELLSQLEIKHDLFRSSMQRLRWPLIKSDVRKYVERLERCKSWIVLVTTSDNLWALSPMPLWTGKLIYYVCRALCRGSYEKICAIEQHLLSQGIGEEQRQKGT